MNHTSHRSQDSARAGITITHVTDEPGLRTWNTIANSTTDRPSTLDDLLGFVHRVPDQLRCVGYLDDVPVATGCAVPDARHPGSMILQIRVVTEHQGFGVGTALYSDILEYLRRNAADTYRVTVRDSVPRAIDFWRRRGCQEVDRDIVVALDVSAYSGSTGAPADVTIASLADAPDRLYDIYDVGAATWCDIPTHEPERTMSFDEWRELIESLEENDPEAIFAACVDGQVVGYAHLALPPTAPHVGWHNYTGVLRTHRGRGIATALKVHMIDWARRHGRGTLMTGNHEANGPMRHINEALGYRKLYAEVTLQGSVP